MSNLFTWSTSNYSTENPHLCSVWKEDRWGQVSCDATEHVDDGDPEPTRQLLYVPQHRHLEKHWHQAVQDPTHTETSFIGCSHIKHLLETSSMSVTLTLVTQHEERERGRVWRTGLGLQDWGKVTSHKRHPCRLPVRQRKARFRPTAPVVQSVSARCLYDSNLRGCEFEPHLEQVNFAFTTVYLLGWNQLRTIKHSDQTKRATGKIILG